jgi:hypothetical protein
MQVSKGRTTVNSGLMIGVACVTIEIDVPEWRDQALEAESLTALERAGRSPDGAPTLVDWRPADAVVLTLEAGELLSAQDDCDDLGPGALIGANPLHDQFGIGLAHQSSGDVGPTGVLARASELKGAISRRDNRVGGHAFGVEPIAVKLWCSALAGWRC